MKNILRQRQLEHANEMYQDKLTELLRLFMAQQCSKWIEDETIFPELVAALYQYTFTSKFSKFTQTENVQERVCFVFQVFQVTARRHLLRN